MMRLTTNCILQKNGVKWLWKNSKGGAAMKKKMIANIRLMNGKA